MISLTSYARAAQPALRRHLTRSLSTTPVREWASASPCSKIPAPLPGAFREPTELWHTVNTESELCVQTVRNEEELMDLIASAAADTLVVVKYHAMRCSASKAIKGKYESTAKEFGNVDSQGPVHFAEICFDTNRVLCDKMGIRSVPHVQIFSGNSGKIADFSIVPRKYGTLTSLLTDRRASADAQGK